MRTSHHHRNTRRAHSVGHLVCLPDHARHGANPHQADVILPDVFDKILHAQTPRVAVDEKYIVTRGCERFQEEHPKMWHEIVGDFIVRIIEKDRVSRRDDTSRSRASTSAGSSTPASSSSRRLFAWPSRPSVVLATSSPMPL